MARRLVIVALLALGACSTDAPDEIIIAGNTMGTQFTVKLVAHAPDVTFLESQIQTSLNDVNRMMSTYEAESEISTFNATRSTDWVPVSENFCSSVEQALELSALTDGAFDITVAPLVNLWGFGPDEMIEGTPNDAQITALLKRVGYRNLHADCSRPALRKDIPELMLDMSACGKGLAVDELAELLDATGIDNYLVEVGGEIRLRGHNVDGKPWAIGIERPLTSERRPHTIVHLTDTALATSGDYRNFFEAGGQIYSHTIDTRTGKPVTHTLASVTVIDRSAYRADALATALLVMGPSKGMEFAIGEGIAAMFLSRDEAGITEAITPALEALRKS